jgi:hypothetical protein
MNRASIPILAGVLERYYSSDEFFELTAIFDISFAEDVAFRHRSINWLGISNQLVSQLEHGNHRSESVIEQLELRSSAAIAATDWERRDTHQNAAEKISKLARDFREHTPIPHELAIPEDRPYTAKAQVREFLEQAETEILVVDP